MKISKLIATGILTGLAAAAMAVPVLLTINTDDFGGETWFEMLDSSSSPLAYDTWTSTLISPPDSLLDDGFVDAGTCGFGETDLCGLDNDTLTFAWELGPGDYTFNIYDDASDGICCAWGIGSYSLVVDGVTVGAGGEFAGSESTAFTIDAAAVPESGTLALLAIGLIGLGLARRKS